MLKKQQKEVVGPLVEQVKQLQEKNIDLLATAENQNKHVKMLSAITRFPIMNEQLRRVLKNHTTPEQAKEADKAAQFTLRQYQLSQD